ncbi:hypothetical protein P3449_18540 [Vibrio parahaemolyticus]|nr:hypothetical protein [Vibrio parahaemolyticus]MDF4268712.1 hypothetical protein [Vibrio parahaemolyticus]MDF4274048.1 hypothetical protein [Vibrio parahaemolyticus]MDF4298570.1 hypothetical protein [Vibrio parahaemolyticus]MDG3050146.1 hypothetical protein [Vibrio parahaemolyticus]
MEELTTENLQQLRCKLEKLPHNRKIMTDYCREHGYRVPSTWCQAEILNFENASSIKLQGSLAV